jgi:predicted PurR-regulated permease PerM
VGFLILTIFFTYIAQAILIVFAAILLAILLRFPIKALDKRTPLSAKWAFVITVFTILVVLILIGWLITPSVTDQLNQIDHQLTEVIDQINQYFSQFPWAQEIIERPVNIQNLVPDVRGVESMLARISGIFSGAFGMVANLIIILVLGLYLAFEPHTYTQGLINLLPSHMRSRAGEILATIGTALKWWLLGRIISMVILGVIVGVGIALLGIPLALVLGIVTGLLSFVPIIGSFLAVIPAGLVALTGGPINVVYVLLLYGAAQGIETYLLTPFVQRHTVLMPPAVALILQLLLGILIGPVGIALAYPIAVVGQVLIKTMYIEDVLREPIKITPA